MTRKWIELNEIARDQRSTVQAVYDGEQNAEWKLLIMWAALQMEGAALEADFEHAATTLLIAAIAHQSLPVRRGKPEQQPGKGSPGQVAAAFNELMICDPDHRREDVIAELAQRFHLNERTIETRLQRADENWTASADRARALLRRTFPATGPLAIKTNSTMLALVRKLSAKK